MKKKFLIEERMLMLEDKEYRTLISGEFNGNLLDSSKLWIEGIGSNRVCNEWERYYPPMSLFPTLLTDTFLVKCTINNIPLYDQSVNLFSQGFTNDFISGKDVVRNEQESAVFYNLQGIRINQPQRGGFYIRNGRKIKY